nr:PREDICTED: serine/threonine-protein kinase MARK2-like [Rhinolophus sinicus]
MACHIREIRVDGEPISAHYKLQEFIGEGTFGRVVLGEHILTKTKVAVKIIKQWGCKKLRRFLLQEVRCMVDLHHPNIIQLFHVLSSAEYLYLVMEFVPTGDMMDYLNEYGRMSEGRARRVFRQLVSAVHYCHEKGVAHRDLKPQNVLLDPYLNVKLTDFGLGAPSNVRHLSTFCGTLFYTAPEVFQGKIYSGCAADTWSLGVLLHEMLTNIIPFMEISLEELVERLDREEYDIPSYLSYEVENLLRKMLTLNPEQRDNLKDFMPHPWLNMDQEEELKPYVEPPRDVIDPWVISEMVNLGFQQEEIKGVVPNHKYNNITATYYILCSQKPKYTYRTIKVKPFHSPKLQSRSPSPEKFHSEWSGFQTEWLSSQKEEQEPVDHKPGQKSQESGGPSAIPESSTTISEPRTISPPFSTGAKTASPERSWGPRNATIELPPPWHCWGSRATTPEHRPGSRTATPEHRPGSRAATPEHRPGSRTATPAQRPGSRTATPAFNPGSSTTVLSPAPQCHPGDSLSSHSTTSSSGNTEENKQGRWRMARRDSSLPHV